MKRSLLFALTVLVLTLSACGNPTAVSESTVVPTAIHTSTAISTSTAIPTSIPTETAIPTTESINGIVEKNGRFILTGDFGEVSWKEESGMIDSSNCKENLLFEDYDEVFLVQPGGYQHYEDMDTSVVATFACGRGNPGDGVDGIIDMMDIMEIFSEKGFPEDDFWEHSVAELTFEQINEMTMSEFFELTIEKDQPIVIGLIY